MYVYHCIAQYSAGVQSWLFNILPFVIFSIIISLQLHSTRLYQVVRRELKCILMLRPIPSNDICCHHRHLQRYDIPFLLVLVTHVSALPPHSHNPNSLSIWTLNIADGHMILKMNIIHKQIMREQPGMFILMDIKSDGITIKSQ